MTVTPWNGPGWYLVAAEWHGEEISNHGTIGADTPVSSDNYDCVGSNGFFGMPSVILAYVVRDPYAAGARITHSFLYAWPERLLAGPIRDFSALQVELESLRVSRANQALAEAEKQVYEAKLVAHSQAKFPWHKP